MADPGRSPTSSALAQFIVGRTLAHKDHGGFYETFEGLRCRADDEIVTPSGEWLMGANNEDEAAQLWTLAAKVPEGAIAIPLHITDPDGTIHGYGLDSDGDALTWCGQDANAWSLLAGGAVTCRECLDQTGVS